MADTTETRTPKTLQEAILVYSDRDVCQATLAAARWPDGRVTCPHCGSDLVAYLKNQRRWQCRSKHPRRQFSVKVGTIFEDSPVGLDKWFTAIWLIAGAKNGISSYEIHRAIDVTQKTAWFMLHRIRLAMQTGSFDKLDGEVEVDETFIGGKARNMHKDQREKMKGRTFFGKAAVMGLLQRHPKKGHSKIRMARIRTTGKPELQSNVERHVEDGATVYTDEFPSYDNLGVYYEHQVINHAESYAKGQVHTNGLENFWSLLKRAIHGTYVSVEPFHLFRYLDEQAFRFNNRKGTDAERFAGVLDAVTGRRVTHGELTGRPADL